MLCFADAFEDGRHYSLDTHASFFRRYRAWAIYIYILVSALMLWFMDAFERGPTCKMTPAHAAAAAQLFTNDV